jgi:hypothetical protein
MTITVELTPELETRLRQEALGRNLEAIRRILAEAATPAALDLLHASADPEEAEILESFHACRARMARASADLSDSEVAAEVTAARAELVA